MTVAVALIDRPAVDLNAIVSITQKCLKFSPLETVDTSPRMLSDAAKALAAYNTLRSRNYKTAVDAIRDSYQVQSLLQYTFLCVSHFEVQIDAICLNTGLQFVTANTYSDGALFLVGGDLGTWRDAVSIGSKHEPTRELFNKIYTEFDRAGLSEVWSDYNRPATKGGFLIERRK